MEIKALRSARVKESRRLGAGFAILFGLVLFEVVGAWRSGSFALLADAGHVLMDVVALGGSFLAARFARRRPTPSFTFGFSRLEIIVALCNGLALFAVAIVVAGFAFVRFARPREVHGEKLLIFAIVGLLVNLACMLALRGARHGSLNMQSAFWHVLGDTLSSVIVVINGLLVKLTENSLFDPAASIIISMILLSGSWRLIRRAGKILLEASEVDISAVIAALRGVSGVADVHHVHIRTLTDGVVSLTARVHPTDDLRLSQCAPLLVEIERVLRERFGIAHVTIQFEIVHVVQVECVLSDEKQKQGE